IKVIFQTYFEKLFNYDIITQLPVAAIGIDFVHGDSLNLLQTFGFPADKYLAAGVIDGRNVWRADLKEKSAKIDVLRQLVNDDKYIIQPYSSLIYVHVTKTLETKIDSVIIAGLSFADEKLQEISTLTNLAKDRDSEKEAVKEATEALENLKQKYRSNKSVATEISKLTDKDA